MTNTILQACCIAGLVTGPLAGVSPAAHAGGDYQEDFEAFSAGGGDGQFGWSSFFPGQFDIVDTGIERLGTRSARYLGADNHGSQNDLVVSPGLGNAYGTIYVDVLIEDTTPFDIGGFVFEVWEQPGSPTARVRFDTTGNVSTQITVGSCLQNYTSTEGTWSNGEVVRLGVAILDDPRSFAVDQRLFIDGQLVYSGSTLGCSGGEFIGRIELSSAHAFGIDLTGSTFTIDNLERLPQLVGDVEGDGRVDFADLLQLLSDWGPCDPFFDECWADFDLDDEIGFADLLILLNAWTG